MTAKNFAPAVAALVTFGFIGEGYFSESTYTPMLCYRATPQFDFAELHAEQRGHEETPTLRIENGNSTTSAVALTATDLETVLRFTPPWRDI
jgi:hypothetical protein